MVFAMTPLHAIETDQMAKFKSSRLANDLNLDTGQVRAVDSILLEYINKVLANTDEKPNPASTYGRPHQKKADNDIMGILNFEQKEKQHELGYPLAYNPQLIKLNHLLDLQKDQVSTIESILEYYNSQFRQLLKDDSGSGRSRFRKLRALMESQNEKIEAKLTDLQRKIYNDYIDELKKEMKNRRRGRSF